MTIELISPGPESSIPPDPQPPVPPRPLSEVLTLQVLPGRLVFRGEIDVLCESAFRTAVASETRRQGGSAVVDLTNIRFLDSGGLTALYSLSQETDLELTVDVLEGSLCDRVLLLSALDRVLPIRRVPGQH